MWRTHADKPLGPAGLSARPAARGAMRAGGDSPLARLFREGYCVVDHVLARHQCEALYAHYNGGLADGSISHVSGDACNVGCASQLLPCAGPQRVAEFGPEPAAVASAVDLLTGVAAEVDAAVGSGVRLSAA